MMKQSTIEDVIKVADYIILHECTAEKAAEAFYMSKATVYKNMSKNLPEIDKERARKVSKMFEKNLNRVTRKKEKGIKVSPAITWEVEHEYFRKGDKVTITTTSGETERGEIAHLTIKFLEINGRNIRNDSVREIKRGCI